MTAHAITDKLPASGYIRQRQLVPAILPISPATLWRMVSAGTFPKPIKLSKRITAWNANEIREWLQKRDDERKSH